MPRFVRLARRFPSIGIEADLQVITAANPLPDDLHNALGLIHYAAGETGLEPTVAKLVHRSELTEHPTLLRIIKERHQMPRQHASHRQPNTRGDKPRISGA